MAAEQEGSGGVNASGAQTITSTETTWRTETSSYFRRPGGWWWAAFIGVPLVLALVGGGFGGAAPAGGVPSTMASPAAPASVATSSPATPAAAPLTIGRSGNTVTLSGSFPDAASRDAAIAALKASLGADITVVDQSIISAGAPGLSAEAAGSLGTALKTVPDLQIAVEDGTVTITGTAGSEAEKDAAGAAVAAAFPQSTVMNIIKVSADAPVDCSTVSDQVATVAGSGQIRFASGASKLTAGGKKAIAAVERLLRACPAVPVVVNGYADNSGTAEANKQISIARAKAVKQRLIANGAKNAITTHGMGAADPVASNSTEKGRSANRRVVILIP